MNKKIQRIKNKPRINGTKKKSVNGNNTTKNIIGPCPKGEVLAVQAIWNRLVNLLGNNLNRNHRTALLNLSRSINALDEIERIITEEGRFIVARSGPSKGSKVPNPNELHRIRTEQQCLSLLKEFNLTPKSATEIGKPRGRPKKLENVFGA